MRRADIVTGASFRAALVAVAIMAVAFGAAGVLAYQTVRTGMLDELERQVVAEALLLEEVYRNNGETALIDAVRALERPELRGDRHVAVMDSNGARLAGNLSVAPDTVDIRRTIHFLPAGGGDTAAVRIQAYETVQLVVGRSTRPIDATLQTLVYALIAAFLLILVAVLATGWFLSRTSLRKLTHIADVLERVGRGDTAARIGGTGQRGQIDRIGSLIDTSLGQLTVLTEASQNTIRAIAHDVRTPLNRALNRLDEAMDAPEHERVALLESAERDLGDLGSVFDTVLRISTLETSLDRTGFVPVDLALIAAETVPLFEADLAERAQQVAVLADAPVVVEGDAQALRQLVVNLLSNANRHAGQGASIRVETRSEREGAVLEVCDTGPGIPADQRADVLRPFVRLDASRTDAGTGLGLALANAIAIRHGATLALEDNAPGLCVRIRFPA